MGRGETGQHVRGPPEANAKRLGLEAGSPEAESTASSGLGGWSQGEGAGGTPRLPQVPSVSETGIDGYPTSLLAHGAIVQGP